VATERIGVSETSFTKVLEVSGRLIFKESLLAIMSLLSFKAFEDALGLSSLFILIPKNSHAICKMYN
jgi:hypothetical protein